MQPTPVQNQSLTPDQKGALSPLAAGPKKTRRSTFLVDPSMSLHFNPVMQRPDLRVPNADNEEEMTDFEIFTLQNRIYSIWINFIHQCLSYILILILALVWLKQSQLKSRAKIVAFSLPLMEILPLFKYFLSRKTGVCKDQDSLTSESPGYLYSVYRIAKILIKIALALVMFLLTSSLFESASALSVLMLYYIINLVVQILNPTPKYTILLTYMTTLKIVRIFVAAQWGLIYLKLVKSIASEEPFNLGMIHLVPILFLFGVSLFNFLFVLLPQIIKILVKFKKERQATSKVTPSSSPDESRIGILAETTQELSTFSEIDEKEQSRSLYLGMDIVLVAQEILSKRNVTNIDLITNAFSVEIPKPKTKKELEAKQKSEQKAALKMFIYLSFFFLSLIVFGIFYALSFKAQISKIAEQQSQIRDLSKKAELSEGLAEISFDIIIWTVSLVLSFVAALVYIFVAKDTFFRLLLLEKSISPLKFMSKSAADEEEEKEQSASQGMAEDKNRAGEKEAFNQGSRLGSILSQGDSNSMSMGSRKSVKKFRGNRSEFRSGFLKKAIKDKNAFYEKGGKAFEINQGKEWVDFDCISTVEETGEEELQPLCDLIESAEDDWNGICLVPLHEDFSSRKCDKCLINPSSSIFMDCSHGGLCKKCALSVAHESNSCFYCGEALDTVLTITKLDLQDSELNGIYIVSDNVRIRRNFLVPPATQSNLHKMQRNSVQNLTPVIEEEDGEDDSSKKRSSMMIKSPDESFKLQLQEIKEDEEFPKKNDLSFTQMEDLLDSKKEGQIEKETENKSIQLMIPKDRKFGSRGNSGSLEI